MNIVNPSDLSAKFTQDGVYITHQKLPTDHWFFPNGVDPRITAKEKNWPRIPITGEVESVLYAFAFFMGQHFYQAPNGELHGGEVAHMALGVLCEGVKRELAIVTIQFQPIPRVMNGVCMGVIAGPQGWGVVKVVERVFSFQGQPQVRP